MEQAEWSGLADTPAETQASDRTQDTGQPVTCIVHVIAYKIAFI